MECAWTACVGYESNSLVGQLLGLPVDLELSVDHLWFGDSSSGEEYTILRRWIPQEYAGNTATKEGSFRFRMSLDYTTNLSSA